MFSYNEQRHLTTETTHQRTSKYIVFIMLSRVRQVATPGRSLMSTITLLCLPEVGRLQFEWILMTL